MSEPKIALFDMDGTLVNYDEAMRRDLAVLKAPGEPEYTYQAGDDGPPHIAARKYLIRRQPNWWLDLQPLRAGWDVLELAERIGFTPHVLTKGPYNCTTAWSQKVEWCRRHLPGVKVTITEDKSVVYGRVLVDDYIPYVEGWLAHRPRGQVIMPAHPWNEGFSHPQVVRYAATEHYSSKWSEVVNRLREAFERGDD